MIKTLWCLYVIECHLAIKKNDHKGIMLTEKSWSQKFTYRMISFIQHWEKATLIGK